MAKTAHKTLYLDDDTVAALPFAKGGRGVYIARDKDLKGFLCVVNRTSKRLVYQSDLREGERRRVVYRRLGDPAHVKVTEARARALEELARQQRLTDPDARAGMPLSEAWEAFKASLSKRQRPASPRTIDDYTQKNEHHLAPTLGKVALKDIKRQDVTALHARLTEENGPYAANGVCRVGHAIYRHAALALEVPDLPALNPFRSYGLFNAEEKRQTGLAEKKLAGWFAQVLTLDNPIMREFWIMAALTGLRRRDITAMQWRHVHLKERYIEIPSPKGGTSRAFLCPITKPMARSLKRVNAAGKVLCDLPKCHPWVFPSIGSESGHIEEMKTDKLTTSPHALRHSYRAMCSGAKIDKLHSQVLMNHSLGGSVHDSYATTGEMFDQLLESAERVSAYIVKHWPKDGERQLQAKLSQIG